MSYSIVNNDICKIKCDTVINESNGIGYMGGLLGRCIKLRGVAESINYRTRGRVERDCMLVTGGYQDRSKNFKGVL